VKVADLFARLRLVPDGKSFKAGDQLIKGIKAELTQLAGLAAVVASVRSSFNFSEQLTDLDIASQGAMGSIGEVRDQILGVSDATGVAREELLAGAQAFVALTGDGEAASDSLLTFARVAKASKAQMADIAGVAARLQQNMGIDPSQFERSFSILIASGKAGAIELKEMASLFGTLTPAAEKFAGGRGIEGLAKLSAAMQLVMQGAGSPAQAATMMESLMGSLSGAAASRLKDEGISVFNRDGSLRELDAIVADIKKKDFRRDKLIEIFGRKEAVGAFEQLTKVEGAWQGLIDTTMTADDVASDYAKRQQSDTAKIARAWNKFRNTIERVTVYIVKALAWLTDNMALVTLAVTALAAAMLILKAASIAAAIASAAAWIIALAPFVLLAAAIAAVILIVEDLYVAFKGGDSVFRDLYLAAKKWIDERLGEIIDDAKDKLIDFLDVGGVFGVKDARKRARESEQFRDAAEADLERQEERLERLGQRAEEQLQASAASRAGWTPEERRLYDEELAQREVETAMRSLTPFGFTRSSDSQSTNNNMNATINVTVPPGADADGVGSAVRKSLSEWWNIELRSTGAATAR
jgi:hypothetical protein